VISWSSSLLSSGSSNIVELFFYFCFWEGESRGRTFNLVGIRALLVIQCYESLIKSTSLTGHILIFLTPTCSLYKQLFVPQQKLQSVKVSFTWSYTSLPLLWVVFKIWIFLLWRHITSVWRDTERDIGEGIKWEKKCRIVVEINHSFSPSLL
jgi:hypothetical protein